MMHHGMHDMHDMHMTFYFDYNLGDFFFSGLIIDTPTKLIALCVVLMVLGIFYEALKVTITQFAEFSGPVICRCRFLLAHLSVYSAGQLNCFSVSGTQCTSKGTCEARETAKRRLDHKHNAFSGGCGAINRHPKPK